MKAPDIIFVRVTTKPTPSITFSEIKEGDDDIEYISKDSLLEWAKEKYNKAYKLHLKKGDNYAYGQGKMDAYQKLFDKIKSL